MSQHYYELNDPDSQQAAAYAYLLTVYLPSGAETYAVDGIDADYESGEVTGWTLDPGEDDVIDVVRFPGSVTYLLAARSRFTKLTQAERIERARESNLTAATQSKLIKDIWAQHGPQEKEEWR